MHLHNLSSLGGLLAVPLDLENQEVKLQACLRTALSSFSSLWPRP